MNSAQLQLVKLRPVAIRIAHSLSMLALRSPARRWLLARRRSRAPLVVVLGDYQDFGDLLAHAELEDHDLVLVTTRRYPFTKLITRRIHNLIRIVIVDGFGDDERTTLAAQLKPFAPRRVLIQAGEFLVPMANFLGRELCDYGNSEEASRASLSKIEMRSALNCVPELCVRFQRVASQRDLDEIDFFPLILKPEIGTGSFGARLVESSADLGHALDASSRREAPRDFRGSYLAEEYIQGRQFDIEGLMVSGEPVILSIAEECYNGIFPAIDHMWFMHNPNLGSLEEALARTVRRALEAIGIEVGAFHCEVRFTDSGEARVIELSNRMGGGFENKILRATGRDFVGLYIKSMLGRPVHLPPNRGVVIFDRYCTSAAEVEQWRAIELPPGVDRTVKVRRFRSFYGIVELSSADEDLLRQTIARVLDITQSEPTLVQD